MTVTKVIVVSGPPESGKSTYISNNIKNSDLVYDYDRIIRAISNYNERTIEKHDAHKMTQDIRWFMLSKINDMKEIDKFYIVTTRVSEELKRYLAKFDTEYIEMQSTFDECIERLSKDDTRKDKEKWGAIIKKYFDDDFAYKKRSILKKYGKGSN